MSAIVACPDCGEPRGGRYRHARTLVCWPCWCRRTGHDPLATDPPASDPAWKAFRRAVIRALDRIDRSRFIYIDEVRIVHVCPVCQRRDGWLSVRFHGRTPSADIKCAMGCPAGELSRALGLEKSA
jgi:hypothetical protein